MKVRCIAKRRLSGDFGSYAWWFHRQVRESLNDPRQTTPHAQVMTGLRFGLMKGKIVIADDFNAPLDPLTFTHHVSIELPSH